MSVSQLLLVVIQPDFTLEAHFTARLDEPYLQAYRLQEGSDRRGRHLPRPK